MMPDPFSLLNKRAAKKIFTTAFQLFWFTSLVFCQQKITGLVTAANNESLEGVAVSVKGSTRGTATNDKGFFSINAKPGEILIFSSVGYRSIQVAIQSTSNLKITLFESPSNLDQVIVTGYTAQKIKEITGSVASVKPEDLTATADGEVEKMLQGRVAGLTVITSGQPGGPSNVRINGIGNFGDVAPLYIIDGVQGDINAINPYDIESLQVLKDAGVYSMYGVRGANGVVIVTTKKGKTGKTIVDFNAYTGLQEPLKKGLDVLPPQGNADILWLAYRNSGLVDSSGNPEDPLYGSGSVPVLPDYFVNGIGYPANAPQVNPARYNISPGAPIYQIMQFNKSGTDWFHELFKPALSQNYSVSMSGGTDMSHYLFSVGYFDQQGTYINTYLKKITVRINTDFKVNQTFHVGENLQLNQSQSPAGIPDIYDAILTEPYLPVYDIQGNWSSGKGVQAGAADNPLAAGTLAKDNRNNNWQIFGNAFAELALFHYLTVRSSFGGSFDFYNSYTYTYGDYNDSLGLSSFAENTGYSRSWTWTNTLSFYKKFAKQNSLKILAGTENVSNYMRGQGGTSEGYLTNNPNYRYLGNGNGVPSDQTIFSAATISFLSSFISRMEYGFKEKYYFTATLREDGSSVFGPQNRFGWFPSLSAAWRITEEKFMQGLAWLTELKLRGSWGKTGYNGNTNPVNQYTLFGGSPGTSFYDVFGTSNSAVQGLRTVQIGNASTGWQQDVMTNLGIESRLFNGKLNLTADWYEKKSNGLLFPITLPGILGYAAPPNINIGEVKNSGVNLLIESHGNITKDFRWSASITVTTYQNRVVRLNDIPYFDDALDNESQIGYLVRNQVGYPIGSFYGYKVIGYFENTQDIAKSPSQMDALPGRFKYLNANGDSIISDADRVHFGDPNPKFTAGINTGINFLNFDFSAFFYWTYGNDVMNMVRNNIDIFATPNIPKSQTALYDSWTPQNLHPRAPIVEFYSSASTNGVINSFPLEKGSYFRNKSLIAGYSFPSGVLEKMKIKRLRVYAEVENLFTMTKYSGLDPELSGNLSVNNSHSAFGIDWGNYPDNQKEYLVGINLSF